ncbi:MAG: hypothetical protein ACLQAT_20115 [Candidatus Binataceae bacterium]
MENLASGVSTPNARKGSAGRRQFDAQAVAKGRAEKYAKWPAEVKHVTMNQGGPVFEGYRALVLTNGTRLRIDWRSKKGVGFWVTAKDYPVYFGKTLHYATLRLAEIAEATI